MHETVKAALEAADIDTLSFAPLSDLIDALDLDARERASGLR